MNWSVLSVCWWSSDLYILFCSILYNVPDQKWARDQGWVRKSREQIRILKYTSKQRYRSIISRWDGVEIKLKPIKPDLAGERKAQWEIWWHHVAIWCYLWKLIWSCCYQLLCLGADVWSLKLEAVSFEHWALSFKLKAWSLNLEALSFVLWAASFKL